MKMSAEICYWNATGKYQEQYNKIWDSEVPKSGEAKTVNGELVRICGRFIYEHSNNGNCNAVDEQNSGFGISEMFKEFLVYAVEAVPELEKQADELQDFIMADKGCTFSQAEYDIYNRFVDKIMEFVIDNK